ncbi:hypothetical protein GA0115240_14954, partial [Streptomyces sp. DvalAA-14]|uniref:ATP-binding protein n=1 Tax=unclassified Streptomyces TaxID=2593676 RepID=UPI00081B40E9
MKGNIPQETTSFVGRRPELARLEAALATHRLVTLTGAGGVGKTRLAQRAATITVNAAIDGSFGGSIGGTTPGAATGAAPGPVRAAGPGPGRGAGAGGASGRCGGSGRCRR